jgi:hypothetical protein
MQKTIPIQLIAHPIIESLNGLDQGHYLRFLILIIRNKWCLPIQVLNFWPHGRQILEQLPELYAIDDTYITAIHGHHVRQVRQQAAHKRFVDEDLQCKNEDLQCKNENRCENEIPEIPEIPVTQQKNPRKKAIFELSATKLELFDQFWKAYPRKVGKQTCKLIWDKLDPNKKLLGQMIATLQWQRETRDWIDGYIPHPSTWLNGHRWEDEPPENLNSQWGDGLG